MKKSYFAILLVIVNFAFIASSAQADTNSCCDCGKKGKGKNKNAPQSENVVSLTWAS